MPDPAATPSCRVRQIARASEAELHGLAEVLIDCVEGGAFVG